MTGTVAGVGGPEGTGLNFGRESEEADGVVSEGLEDEDVTGTVAGVGGAEGTGLNLG